MTADFQPNSSDPFPSARPEWPISAQGGAGDLISPVLYDLVMWGFTEQNSLGERVLRSDIQDRLDGDGDAQRRLNDLEGNPLYVGYRCQACWEAAVTLVTYGHHLCAWDARPLGAPPHRSLP
jgi:hypothetical protein